MKKNISNKLTLTVLCILASVFFLGNVTAYAAESDKANTTVTFTICYDNKGANGAAPIDKATYCAGDSATIMGVGDLTKDNKTFVGWSKNQNETTVDYIPGDIIKIQNDTTLYAVWADNQEQKPLVVISSSGSVCRTQMGAVGDSFFPDRTFY